MSNTKDTIIGVIAFSLFTAVLIYGFVQDIDHTYERNIAIAEKARAENQYISPSDEVLIEIMEHDNESCENH